MVKASGTEKEFSVIDTEVISVDLMTFLREKPTSRTSY
jgi:hypothetical protein